MAMDGINEKGFSIAVLQVRATPTKQNTGKKPAITTVLIRAALDKCATVEEGIKLFATYDMQDLLGVNYHYQLSDAQGNSAIIEYIDNKMVVIRQEAGKENLMVTNVRHKNLLDEGERCMVDALEMVEFRQPLEFIEIDINRCYEALGEIIGETASDIIDKVFERFCLGK